jgi:hypothetical protein
MRGKTSLRSLSGIGCFVALLSGLASRPAPGAELGLYAMTSLSMTRMQSTASSTGQAPSGSDSSTVGMRLAMGYQREANFAYECTLGALGRTEAVSGATTWAASGYGCGALVLMPSEGELTWFLKGAMQKVRLQMAAVNAKEEVRGWSPSLALGVKRDFSKVSGWRFEYERMFDVGNASLTGKFALNTLLVSLIYGFQ